MKSILRCIHSFVVVTLVASQITYSGSGTTTLAPPASTTNATVTVNSATTTNEDFYKAILLALYCEIVAMQKIACANRNTQNPGFFLNVITSVDNDYTILLKLGNGITVGDGATCLAVNSQISVDVDRVVATANQSFGCPQDLACSVTDGLAGGGIRAYYKCILHELGRDLVAMYNAAGAANGIGGPYQQLIVKTTTDTNNLLKVVDENDSSQNCLNANTEFASDLQAVFALGSGAYVCPYGSGTTTTVGSVSTVAGGGSGY